MEKPNAKTIDMYNALLPNDARVNPGQMFGHPCAFVNGNMFFGTFAQTLVARVGSEQASALVGGGVTIFEPMAGRAWKEYVQFDPYALDEQEAAKLAVAALEHTAKMPPKKKKARKKAAG